MMTVSAAVSAILTAVAHASPAPTTAQPTGQALQASNPVLQASLARARSGSAGAAFDLSTPIAFQIPPQSLATALVAFSAQAGVQFTAPGTSLTGVQCLGLHGSFAPEVALRLLLRDTGFTYRRVGATTVAISASDTPNQPATPTASSDTSGSSRVAQANQRASAPPADSSLQEVTVTATRRAESVLEIPYNISAVTAVDIQNSGAVDVETLSTMVPGLQAPNEGLRGNELPQFTIRGLNVSPNGESSTTPGGEAPLVSMYSDDTPLEANLKMTDLARVEVLRGPQSTLYGSGAVGGTVRLIHNQPDTTRSTFEVSVDGSQTYHATGPSGSIDTIFNVPFSDSVALRGSAGWSGYSGFTDAISLINLDSAQQPILANPSDPLTSGPTFKRKNGIDDATEWYVRLAGLWKFSDFGQADLTYQHQQTWAGGFPYEQPGLHYEEGRYWREWGKNDTDLASLDVSANAGFATISSTTSFTNQRDKGVSDETGLIEELNPILYGNYPRVSSPLFVHDQIKTITEELRFVSNGSGPLSWVAGIWYSYQYAENGTLETFPGYAAWTALPGSGIPPGCTVFNAVSCPFPTYDDALLSFNATPPSMHLPNTPADGIYYYYAHTYFHDFAPLYGELTYHITPKWQVTGGGRLIIQKFSENIGQLIPVCGAACSETQTDPTGSVYANTSITYHKQVYKANTSYEVSPAALLYYTWSQGFRRGGANGLPFGTCLFCVPESQLVYQPDLAVNNEVGIKGRILSAATYTFTLYNINWHNPQINGTEPISGLLFIGNANSARSRGVESEITVAITRGTHVTVGYAYTNAILTADFNVANGAIVGFSGDRLPGVSKQQINAAIDYTHPLSGDLSFNARADVAYRSDFWTETPHSVDAALLPGYTLLALRTGVDLGSTWKLEAYVDNVTNSQGISGFTYTKAFLPHNYAYFVSRPRTVGINVTYTFEGKPR
jgi:outer membrane receptor protein involved in Fe transport